MAATVIGAVVVSALLIGAVLWIAAGVAGWRLSVFAERIHERAEAGKGNASQASGSPGRDGKVRRG